MCDEVLEPGTLTVLTRKLICMLGVLEGAKVGVGAMDGPVGLCVWGGGGYGVGEEGG